MLEASTFEDVLQIRLTQVINGTPVYWVAAFLVDGMLIDTGCQHTSDEMLDFLRGQPIDLIANTHFHEDHIGANRLLQERFGIDAFAHADSVPLMKKKLELLPYQELVWGYPETCEAKPLPEQIRTELFCFEPIETPGHSVGHVAFLERERGWCFCGDLFAREKPKVLRADESVGPAMRSMRMLADLETERLVLLTSVGKIIEDGRRALRECVAYLEELSEKTHALHDQGQGEEQIVATIFGGEHGFAGVTGGHYSSANLVRSLLETT